MEGIVITAIICLSVLGVNVINKDVRIKKAELIGQYADKIIDNLDKFDDEDMLLSLLLQIKSSLD